MSTETYSRIYTSEKSYICPQCGNSQFAAGAFYCHICGQKLPAGMYIEGRFAIQINAETTESRQEDR